jgi:hypothetical protein
MAGPSSASVPELKNLTIENITENVQRINSQCADPRLKYVLERLVSHVHDFARETRLSFDEWMAGIQFLTKVGQTCTDVRQVRCFPLQARQGGLVDACFRSSSSSPTSSASPSSSTASTTPSPPLPPKAPSSGPSTHTMRPLCPLGPASRPIPRVHRFSWSAR